MLAKILKIVPIEGTLNSDKYSKIVNRNVVNDMKEAFPNGSGIFDFFVIIVTHFVQCEQ